MHLFTKIKVRETVVWVHYPAHAQISEFTPLPSPPLQKEEEEAPRTPQERRRRGEGEIAVCAPSLERGGGGGSQEQVSNGNRPIGFVKKIKVHSSKKIWEGIIECKLPKVLFLLGQQQVFFFKKNCDIRTIIYENFFWTQNAFYCQIPRFFLHVTSPPSSVCSCSFPLLLFLAAEATLVISARERERRGSSKEFSLLCNAREMERANYCALWKHIIVRCCVIQANVQKNVPNRETNNRDFFLLLSHFQFDAKWKITEMPLQCPTWKYLNCLFCEEIVCELSSSRKRHFFSQQFVNLLS